MRIGRQADNYQQKVNAKHTSPECVQSITEKLQFDYNFRCTHLRQVLERPMLGRKRDVGGGGLIDD